MAAWALLAMFEGMKFHSLAPRALHGAQQLHDIKIHALRGLPGMIGEDAAVIRVMRSAHMCMLKLLQLHDRQPLSQLEAASLTKLTSLHECWL